MSVDPMITLCVNYVSRPLAIPTEDKDLDRKIQLTLYYIKS